MKARTEVPHVVIGAGGIPLHLFRTIETMEMPAGVILLDHIHRLSTAAATANTAELLIAATREAEIKTPFTKETAYERAHPNEPFYVQLQRNRKRRKHRKP